MIKRLVLILSMLCLIQNAFANVQQDMHKFFTDIGGATNVSPAGAYKGQ
jgi:hypothetical protein